ncbi:hypothetical protein Tco_1053781 [Tanacetum coccineum]|uniref:Uncharacterized protein n=1 Tax=Tanacetum coccineum TaxID=301880 RepID=A0ABQ5GVY2_9ASTR
MLAPSSYVQWKSQIKRYISTKPNQKIIMHCIDNVPYEYQMVSYPNIPAPATKNILPQLERTELETYATVRENIYKLIDAEAEFFQIILTGIDNDIYSTIDSSPNDKEMNECVISSSECLAITSPLTRKAKNEVNEIRSKCLARNSISFALADTTQQKPKPKVSPSSDENTGPTYDSEPLEKVDSKITPDSTDMSNNEGEVDQVVVQYQEERVLLASLIENMKLEIDERKHIN